MAIEALFHQTTPGVDALDLRRLIAALSAGNAGVLSETDLVGTATSTTNFRVSAGTALINHNTAGNGQFLVTNDADVNQTINAPGSGTKHVTVYLRLQDGTLGDGANAATVTKREETTATYGIPAGQSGIELYRIVLPAGASLTSGATITSTRRVVGVSSSLPPVGSLQPYAGSTAPSGWLICNGASVSQAAYPALYAVIGLTYGGSGGNFNLPDLRGRVPVGLNASDSDFNTLGETGGAKTHTLTTSEMPIHSHSHVETRLTIAGGALFNAGAPGAALDEATENRTTGDAGSGQAHNNLQPYITVNYLIKT